MLLHFELSCQLLLSIYVHACCSNIMCYSGASYEVTNDLAECDSSLHGVLLTLLEHDWLH